MFKKIITLLLAITMGISANCETLPLQDFDISSQKAFMQEVNEGISRQVNPPAKQSTLSAFVTKKLQEYYGRTDFKDEGNKTGWFRVDRFLDWVNKNEKKLKNSTFKFGTDKANLKDYSVKKLVLLISGAKNSYTEEEKALWLYLGTRYIESIFKDIECDFTGFTIIQGNTAHANITSGAQIEKDVPRTIIFNPDVISSIPLLVNTGIHEATHLLPTLMAMDSSNELLNELATFYSQYNFGLPVKISEVKDWADSTRDVRRIHDALPNTRFVNEYNYFITGLILNKQLTPEKVSKLKNPPSVYNDTFTPNMMLTDMVTFLLAAQNNSFMIEKDSLRLPASDYYKIVEKAKLFNFSQQEVKKWFDDSINIDLGEQIWPNTDKKVNVILKYAENQKVEFIGGLQRFNVDQLLQLEFGEFANNPNLKEFYNKLIQYLDISIIDSNKRFFSVITSTQRDVDLVRKLNNIYIKPELWEEAIIKALDDVTTDSVPVPEGYL